MAANGDKGSGAPNLTLGEVVALIIAFLALIGLAVILAAPDMLGNVSALVAILLAIAAGIPPTILIVRRLAAHRSLTLLASELQALRIGDSKPLLDLTGFSAGLFTGIRGHAFFSLRLHEDGLHWLDLSYFNILNILCRHGFRCHLLLIEFTNETMPEANRQRCVKRLKMAAALLIGKKVRIHLYSRGEIRLSGEQLFKSIDCMIEAMRIEDDDALVDSASRAAKSILWALYLQSWSKKRTRRWGLWRTGKAIPFAFIQFEKTAHRRAWLFDYGCHFIKFPTIPFVAKPSGPILDIWSPDKFPGKIADLACGLGDQDALTMAYLIARVSDSLWETFKKRRKYIDDEGRTCMPRLRRRLQRRIR